MRKNKVGIFKQLAERLSPIVYFRHPELSAPAKRHILQTLAKLTPARVFSIPRFDDETEQQFWDERHPVLLVPLQWALVLGAIAFLAYLIFDMATGHVTPFEAALRSPIIVILFGFFIYLHKHPDANRRINRVAKFSAALSAADLIAMLICDGDPAYYPETWPGLLPMYFFSYGQMFMSLRATIGFGWGTALVMPLSGYWVGVDSTALIPSILNLTIVNLFGVCTRCQLEAYSRKSFLAKRKAEDNADDKTRFLHQLSHNLRQPLQALSCYSAVLETAHGQQPDADTQRIAAKMGCAIDELNHAFNRILDIANLESGKQLPLLASVDINVLLSGLEDQYAGQASARGLKLIVRLRRKPPYCVHSDAIMLRQIVGNLIDNALKYTRSGWILVGVTKVGDQRLKLHVRDSGIGIADAVRQDIFKEFHRCQRRRTDAQTHGLGIGLAYVSAAIKRLPDHALSLQSKLYNGSDFQIYLPALAAVHRTVDNPRPAYSLAGCFVLLVDDDRQVLSAMAQQLVSWDCLVQTAASLAEAQSVLAENIRQPDLLITDYYLGDNETAHDIIAAVCRDYGPLPVLVLSARAISNVEKAKLPPNTQLLRKPAGAGLLMAAIARTMEWASA